MSDKVKTAKESRQLLKNIIHEELEKLPDTLKEMKPEKRLDYVIKLLPYALPKSNPVSSNFGEPDDFFGVE